MQTETTPSLELTGTLRWTASIPSIATTDQGALAIPRLLSAMLEVAKTQMNSLRYPKGAQLQRRNWLRQASGLTGSQSATCPTFPAPRIFLPDHTHVNSRLTTKPAPFQVSCIRLMFLEMRAWMLGLETENPLGTSNAHEIWRRIRCILPYGNSVEDICFRELQEKSTILLGSLREDRPRNGKDQAMRPLEESHHISACHMPRILCSRGFILLFCIHPLHRDCQQTSISTTAHSQIFNKN